MLSSLTFVLIKSLFNSIRFSFQLSIKILNEQFSMIFFSSSIFIEYKISSPKKVGCSEIMLFKSQIEIVSFLVESFIF